MATRPRLNPRLVVIDASLSLNLVLPLQPYFGQARRLDQLWQQRRVGLIAPPLYESEVDSVVLRRIRRGELTVAAAASAQALLDELPVDIIQDRSVRPRARQIAARFNQERVYDATYAALAELTRCEFWTADRDFHHAVNEGLPYVRFVGEYLADASTIG